MRELITGACVLIAVLNLPLILRKVRPNPIYGFRTRLTVSKPEIWYPANVFSGWAFLVAEAICVGLIWFGPKSLVLLDWYPLAVFMASLAVAVALSYAHLRRYR